MKKLLSTLAAVFAFLALVVMPVKADPFNGGVAIGVIVASADFNTDGKETEGNALNAPNGEIENISKKFTKTKDYASLFAEATVRTSGLGVGLTLGGEYIPGKVVLGSGSRTDTTADATETNQDDNTYTAEAEASDLFTLYVEPTFYLNDSIGIYGRLGMASVNVKSLENIESGTDSSAYGDKMVTGTVTGFGIRAISPWGIFVKVDYSEVDYDNITMTSNSGNKNKISADIDQEATRLLVGYQF